MGVKPLPLAVIEDNRRVLCEVERVRDCASTLGIGTSLEAREILLLGAGPTKRDAVAKAVEGPLTASVTASALQLHPRVTVLLDREAAAGLRHLDYYERVMRTTAAITPGRAARARD